MPADGGFELSWVERADRRSMPPARRGFGATLLERVTGRELGGEAKHGVPSPAACAR